MRNVGDLIEILERFERDTPILVAYQPGWPLQSELVDCLSYSEVFDADYDYDEDDPDPDGPTKEDEFREAVQKRLGREADDICYLTLSGSSDYAPREVFQ